MPTIITSDSDFDPVIAKAIVMVKDWDWAGEAFVQGIAVGIVLAHTKEPRILEDWDASDDSGFLNPELKYVYTMLLAGLQSTLPETNHFTLTYDEDEGFGIGYNPD